MGRGPHKASSGRWSMDTSVAESGYNATQETGRGAYINPLCISGMDQCTSVNQFEDDPHALDRAMLELSLFRPNILWADDQH